MTIKRAVVISQAKGGVGKTTLTSNVAGLAAAGGARVLAVDLDQQGNLARDLGYEPANGQALVAGLMATPATLPVTKGVREGLDVVAGGPAIADVVALFESRKSRGESDLAAALEEGLAAIAGDYDLILIDTPPGERVVVESAMSVASALVIPTRSDDASIDGVSITAQRFIHARSRNPHLRLAGVVLFALNSRSTRIETDVRKALEGLLEGAAPVFPTYIRNLESAAVDARRHGLLVHELEQAGKQGKTDRLATLRQSQSLQGEARTAFLRDQRDQTLYASNSTPLAEDFAALTSEIVARVMQLEQEGS